MELFTICKCTFLLVGLVQLIKNLGFAPKKGARFWTLVTVAVGVLVGACVLYLPLVVIDIGLFISCASLFYDTIYKALENWASRLKLPALEAEAHV